MTSLTELAAPETTTPSVRVHLVILSWNQRELTLACLWSLSGMVSPGIELHTILVDNGSTDGTVESVQREFPSVEVVQNGQNLGFAAGNNVGIRQALAAGTDYVMLLNQDTEVAADMLCLLVDAAEQSAEIGVVGPMIYYYDAPDTIWTAGGSIDRPHGWSISLREGEIDDGKPGVPYAVDFVSGCAMLVKRAVIEEVGLLDERYFAYYEETDWCARAREAGYQVWLLPAAKVWHKIDGQQRVASPWYMYLMTRNRLLYLRNRGVATRHLVASTLPRELLLLAKWSVLPRYRDRRPLRSYRLRGVVDFMRNRFGAPSF